MQDTFFSKEQKVSGIIICKPADPVSRKFALKYSYIDNTKSEGVSRFVKFARGFPTALYINFYSRKDARYLGRCYINR